MEINTRLLVKSCCPRISSAQCRKDVSHAGAGRDGGRGLQRKARKTRRSRNLPGDDGMVNQKEKKNKNITDDSSCEKAHTVFPC